MPEKGDIIEMGSMIGGMFIMMIISSYTRKGPFQMMLIFGDFAMMIGVMFVPEYYYRIVIAKWQCFQITIYPWNITRHIFVDAKRSYPIEGLPDHWGTRLHLADPITLPTFGPVTLMDIHHELKFEERIEPNPRSVPYKSFWPTHAQVDTLILYVPEKDAADMDYGDPVPKFRLWHASRDYSRNIITPTITIQDPRNPARLIKVSSHRNPTLDYTRIAETEVAKQNQKLQDELTDLTRKHDALEQAYSVRTRDFEDVRARYVTLLGLFKGLKNELDAVIKMQIILSKAVAEYLLAFWRWKRTLQNAVRALTGPSAWNLKDHIGTIAGAAVALAFLGFLYFNQTFTNKLLSFLTTQYGLIAIVVILGMTAVVLYFWRTRR